MQPPDDLEAVHENSTTAPIAAALAISLVGALVLLADAFVSIPSAARSIALALVALGLVLGIALSLRGSRKTETGPIRLLWHGARTLGAWILNLGDI